MKTILKWPGGKERELPVINRYIPAFNGRYIEPFVGGGAVFFDIISANCCINDKSEELINLYNCIKNKDNDLKEFLLIVNHEFSSLGNFVDTRKDEVLSLYHGEISIEKFIDDNYEYFSKLAQEEKKVFYKELKRNLKSKISRSEKLELQHGQIPDEDRLDNIESSLKSAYYMYMRYLLNNPDSLSNGKKAAVFFFVREYCYSSMFRYNSKGEFNVPYGGVSYNKKDFKKKIDYLCSEEIYLKLNSAIIKCDDFEAFVNELELNENDFIFLDPPYDSDFSTYAQNEFGRDEQTRLCECLKRTKAKFLLIIKNTDFIYGLYKDDFNMISFDKKYSVSFMNRNNRDVEHLVITNY